MENQWLFPDGTILPVVSGGSDDSLNLPTEIPYLDNSTEPTVSDFAQGVLRDIPDEDRPIVEKYIKTWDGNVTKKFQSIHDEYRPYKELGPVEDVQTALQMISLMNDDPIHFYNQITEALREHGMLPGDNDDQDFGSLPEYEGLPPQFVKQYEQMAQKIEEFESRFGDFEQSITQKEQIAQVDNLLKTMHTTHGDFDEEYFLTKLAQGHSPDEAIKAWNDTIQKYSSQPKRAPNLIPGSGSVPNGQVDFSKMSKQEVLSYATNRLREANGNS